MHNSKVMFLFVSTHVSSPKLLKVFQWSLVLEVYTGNQCSD